MTFAFVSLRRVIQVAPEPKAGGHLVTSGVDRWLRHPIRTANVLIVVALLVRKPTLVARAIGCSDRCASLR
jgi:protein-S-isoprenylcysteine O-methyltransferase Ste14